MNIVRFCIQNKKFRYWFSVAGTSILCGLYTSIVIHIWIVLPYFRDINGLVYYFIPVLFGINHYLALRSSQFSLLVLKWFITAISFAVAEHVLLFCGFVLHFFHLAHGEDAQMWAGDGFGIYVVYLYSLFGIAGGTVIAFFNWLTGGNGQLEQDGK